MTREKFWEEAGKICPEIMNTADDLSKDSCLFFTDLSNDVTWIPDKTAKYFGIRGNMHPDFYHFFLEKVHPYDRSEYLEAMEKKCNGQEVGNELYIRLQPAESDRFYMYGFWAEVLKQEGKNRYLLIILKNENVIPEIDPLTDLYGRNRFERTIAQYIQEKRRVTILEIEIDHINDINVLYGTNYSDEIQRKIALELIYMMDEKKAVYRMDNGNFMFILKDSDRIQAEEFLLSVKSTLREKIQLDGQHFELQISAGGMVLEQYEGEIATVQSKLEYTLERGKKKGHSGLLFFNDLVKINGGTNLDLMKVLHQSVMNGCEGFFVEYQPVVNAKDGRIEGAEALVRWKKEPYGVVPPGMFIDWLEDNPCMYDLGNFVLERALRDGVGFLEKNPDLILNVNVSARQLERKDFRSAVLELLEKTGFPAENLCLEITERCRNLPLELLREEVSSLKKEGIRFAVDDYGTGSASSNVVLQVPVDEIKVDMSFIRGITDNYKQQMMVQTIVSFANSIHLQTCLEGVENEELQDYLRSFGATWFQGYYYSKPVGSGKLEELLACEREEKC